MDLKEIMIIKILGEQNSFVVLHVVCMYMCVHACMHARILRCIKQNKIIETYMLRQLDNSTGNITYYFGILLRKLSIMPDIHRTTVIF